MANSGFVARIKEIIHRVITGIFRIIAWITTRGRLGSIWSTAVIEKSFLKTVDVFHNGVTLTLCTPTELVGWLSNTFSTKEPDTLDWIDSFVPDSVFWDVGANIGLYSLYAAKRSCRVYSFEPSVFNLELLSRNIWLNDLVDKITIVPIPLSSDIVQANLNMSSMAWGGALSTFNADHGHDGNQMEKEFEFRTFGISMDKVVELLKISSPRYLKIDVDGIEHIILEGGEKVISGVESLLVEINEAFTYQSEKVCQLLSDAGMICTDKIKLIDNPSSRFASGYNLIWTRSR